MIYLGSYVAGQSLLKGGSSLQPNVSGETKRKLFGNTSCMKRPEDRGQPPALSPK